MPSQHSLLQHSQQRQSRGRQSRGRQSCGGFTIAEVALAMIVFTMMTILFASVFPMAVRGAQHGGSYAQAATITQHKLDQLRAAGYGRLYNPTGNNSLASLNIIDSPQPSGYPIAGPSGATTYSFTAADNLVSSGTVHGYFAPGSTGTVTIQDYRAFNVNAGIPGGTAAYVTVALTWTTANGPVSSYSASTVITGAAAP